jgi:hypothetical protein
MDLGKWAWRLVLVILVVFMIITGYRLSLLLLKSQTLGPAVLAQVSLMSGTALHPDELTLDQDLLTVSAARPDITMTWDDQAATAQLVIDPRKLPEEKRASALFKWLVAVPKRVDQEMKFCLSAPDVLRAECYQFSRTPTVTTSSTLSDEDLRPAAPEEPSVTYPRTLVSAQGLGNGLVSLFVTLEPVPEAAQGRANPRKLSLRVQGTRSPDSQRLNGYPFLQQFLAEGSEVNIEVIDTSSGEDFVYETSSIPDLRDGSIPLKGSAPVAPPAPSSPDMPSLNFHWLGTDKTAVDSESRTAIDHSEMGRDFSTKVRVQSGFREPVKILVQLLDSSTTFSLTIAPSQTGEVLVNVKNLSYGQHRLQLNALLPSGQKTADVVIPFQYRASSWYQR